MKKLLTFLCAVTLVLGSINFANATTINGLGSPLSDPALVSGTVIDFESEALSSFTSLTIDNVTFNTDSAGGYISTDYAGSYNSTGAKNLQNGTNGFQTLTFDFTGTVGAFGFHFGASNEDWLLQAYDTGNNLLDSYLLPQTWWENNGQFFGIAENNIALATLTQLTHDIDPIADHILLDDFTYAYASAPIPEPATMLLLGSGLIGLAGLGRKKLFKKD
jgi:hypothetical protein